MSKIENWKKIDDGYWKNIHTGEKVRVDRSITNMYNRVSKYYVIVEYNNTKRQFDNVMFSKAEAMKSALLYMRTNIR